ncbi:MAG: NAD-dependent epimerase/dehydratase family protein [Chloroflexota bacterium]
MSESQPVCLVLGATGFIGGHIARCALEEGYHVRGYRRDPGSTGHLGKVDINWFNGDLTDLEALVKAMQAVDVVFHAAAFYPSHSNASEVAEQVAYASGEIKGIIQAARQTKVSRFVYTSSLTTIGQPPSGTNRLADESDFYIPGTLAKSAYYESKIAMEACVLEAARDGFPAVVVNPTAVFGPGDVHLTLGKILIAIKRGYVIAWVPATTNVVDVRDIAIGHLAAAQKGRIGERYILGGFNTSIKDIIDRVASIFKVSPPRFYISINFITLIVKIVDFLPFLSSGNHMRAIPFWQGFNTQKTKQELGMVPRPFEETVEDAMSWFKKNGIEA